MFGRSAFAWGTRAQRIRLVVAALVVVLVGVIVAEVAHQVADASPAAGRRAAASWSSALQPLAAESAAVASQWQAVTAAPTTMSRATLTETLAALRQVTANDLEAFGNLGIGAPDTSLNELAARVFEDRSVAATKLALAVGVATGPGHDTGPATADCVVAYRSAAAADAAVVALEHQLLHTPGARPVDDTAWTKDKSSAGGGRCATLTADLAGDRSLEEFGALHLVAISILPSPVQINGVPNPTTTTSTTTTLAGATGSTGATGASSPTLSPTGPSGAVVSTTSSTTTTTTLPSVTTTTLQIPPAGSHSYLLPTSSITVEIVLANTGDAPVGPVTLSAQLLASIGAPSPQRSTTIPTIAAGGSCYVRIGPLSTHRLGTSFTLQVRATAPGTAAATSRIALDTRS